MALEALERENELSNPLDRVERIAEAYDWAVSRTDAREVTMEVSGGWSDMTISLNWRDEFEILHVAVSLEMKVPSNRRDEVAKLLARINEQLLVGHFDLWHLDGSLVFRNNLLLSGNAEANDAQCEALIRFAGDVDTRRSTTGYVFKISGGPVSWQSRMQTSVALSSMEAEYMAASAATQEMMWLNRLLHQLGFRTPRPTVLYKDNKAAI